MTYFLDVATVEDLHRSTIEQSGGTPGLRDRGGLESAVAAPQATFGGEDLYPDLVDKATALAFSLIRNHPFMDGNKRTAWLAMEVFLLVNEQRLMVENDEGADFFLALAAGEHDRTALVAWLTAHVRTD